MNCWSILMIFIMSFMCHIGWIIHPEIVLIVYPKDWQQTNISWEYVFPDFITLFALQIQTNLGFWVWEYPMKEEGFVGHVI